MSRPHLSKSIDQLEDLFATSMSGEAVLEQLAEELSFRRTPRAKELLNEVRNALSLIQRERGHTPQETAPQRQEPRGRTPSAVSAAPPRAF